ncbi:MAG: nucleotidyltransferase family protein [Saprospiraceae bacterium]|nr:nucleotidyltransferase family protein [Saprospiraceae bacterium]MBL0099687.1 nucleotidyltransferase family protein [Saprospiraceae bacterium]
MKNYSAVILAGGLGTRLKSAVPDLPKCLAPVAGKPFLDHVITYLLSCNVTKFVFALGYRHEMVLEHLQSYWPQLDYTYTVEQYPAGTGGAISLASVMITADDFIVVNGDTLFKADLDHLMACHFSTDALVTLVLKPMKDFDRYGTVQLDKTQTVTLFCEKKYMTEGIINGGVYAINKSKLIALNLPPKYSFEKEVLEKHAGSGVIKGVISEAYFIDIGIPEDFKKADTDLC